MVEKPAGVEEVWKNFKECLIQEAIEVCGEENTSLLILLLLLLPDAREL